MRAILLPPGADLADAFASDLFDRSRPQLPDLAAVTVAVPAPAAIPHLRRRLAHHAQRGLLGPRIHTLAGLAAQQPGAPPLSALECRLLLTEALRRYRNLFPGQDNARVAEALFELFEDLTLHQVEPGPDEAAFQDRLRRAYGTPPLAWLSREAQIVHTLWTAFRADSAERSPAEVHLRKLRAVFEAGGPVHLVGIDEFSRAELALVRDALRAGRAELWLSGRTTGHDGAATAALVQALGEWGQVQFSEPPPRRPAAAGEIGPDPISALLDSAFDRGDAGVTGPWPLRIVAAGSAEHEARCVDLAVRQALLAGAGDVVVLTQDRRLARRLRALLERANVPLQDPAGWALSTSRAAAALDAWLECIEGSFRFRPLLELLKSGYADVDPAALDRLERELVYRKGIDGGLSALLAAAHSKPLESLLKQLKAAAFALPRDGAALPAQRWIEQLAQSLERIGLRERLQGDEAGAQLARLLGQLAAAFARVPLTLRWDEFRDLLDGAVEHATFAPAAARGAVRLLTLEQAVGLRCEHLIVAGATREQLPGGSKRDPFFSQSVRAELGLPDWRARQQRALARLRGALDGAQQVLVTYAAGADDEPAQASPWIEALEAQAARAGVSLRDAVLPRLAMSGACEVGDATAGPAAPQRRPAPATPRALLPEKLSATAHQALLDCPYRFFARSLLKLEAEHAPDEDPDRSDYGKRVHRILHAFATQVDDLPPPFTARIGAANRAEAQRRLEDIAAAVFAPDLQQRALAMTWSAEFHASIPGLLEWMSRRPQLQQVQTEVELAQDLDGLRLHGYLDRLETQLDGTRVIVDYKAGKVPREADVRCGEAVQLLHYALLDAQVGAVEYRPLRDKRDGKHEPITLEGAELAALRDAARARLRQDLVQLRAAAPLPAQGIEEICRHCDYTGLCRREDWHD
jgi:ATP-dependent helicase/nuclease subunit B